MTVMNTKFLALIALLVLLLPCFSEAQNISDLPYPNPVKYLPGPPDSLSMAFANDMHLYFYHKSLRATPRGEQALTDVGYGAGYVANRMEGVFGINIMNVNAPALRDWYLTALNYILQPCGAAKTYYNRQRPFDRFKDPLFSDESAAQLRRQGSYPSAHSSLGWAAALLLSEINPSVQDDLFESGYEYGQSRLIIGAHWQSDVDAARLMATATFARLHASDEYNQMLTRAQAAYDSITHYNRPTALNQRHPMVRFLPPMPDSTSTQFAHDVTSFYQNKLLRDGERGQQAVADADMSLSGLASAFSPLLGINISEQNTPKLCAVMQTVIAQAGDNCRQLHQGKHRTPPYRRLNEPALTVTTSEHTCSYPSQHATVGWAMALTLIDICPTMQNDILLRGREYGQSRVIAGANWQSDIDAGLLLGGMVYANLVSDPSFLDSLSQAREEYNRVSGIATVVAQPSANGSTGYTLDGRCATSATKGVIVFTNGTKVLQ